jgi:hypothetical protein
MSQSAATPAPPASRRGARRLSLDREIAHYPSTRRRVFYLALTVLATIFVYYQQLAGNSVLPTILSEFGIAFSFYVGITAFAVPAAPNK